VAASEILGVFSLETMSPPGKNASESWQNIWNIWLLLNEKIVPVSKLENILLITFTDLKE
jgi:hypothetical protein